MPNVKCAEDLSKYAALHHNGDVSKWVKNSHVGRKPPNRQIVVIGKMVSVNTCLPLAAQRVRHVPFF